MVQEGDRVRMIGVMPGDPDPIEVGSEGTVTFTNPHQIGVEWDSGRSLMLLPGDPFIVLGRGGVHRKPDPHPD